MRDNNPQALEKITGIAGDVSLDNLGISEENVKLLHTNVSVVFHIAATVKFEEPLKKAVNINVCGTERLLNLCKGMKKLAVSFNNASVKLYAFVIFEELIPGF